MVRARAIPFRTPTHTRPAGRCSLGLPPGHLGETATLRPICRPGLPFSTSARISVKVAEAKLLLGASVQLGASRRPARCFHFFSTMPLQIRLASSSCEQNDLSALSVPEAPTSPMQSNRSGMSRQSLCGHGATRSEVTLHPRASEVKTTKKKAAGQVQSSILDWTRSPSLTAASYKSHEALPVGSDIGDGGGVLALIADFLAHDIDKNMASASISSVLPRRY